MGSNSVAKKMIRDVKNVRWSEEDFLKVRRETLSQWPTGKDIDLDEAIAYHKKMPDHKNVAKELSRALKEGITLVQPLWGSRLSRRANSAFTMSSRRRQCRYFTYDH